MPLKKLVHLRLYLLVLLEACLVGACFLAATAALIPLDLSLYLDFEGGWQRLAVVVGSYMVASYLFDFFRQIQAASRLAMLLPLLQLTGLMLMIQAIVGFIDPELRFPQLVAIAALIAAGLLLAPWRLYVRPLLWNAFGARQVLMIGGGPGQVKLAEAFRSQAFLGTEVAGSIVPPGERLVVEPVLGTVDDYAAVVRQIQPDYVIVSGGITNKDLLRSLMLLKAGGVTVHTVGQAWEVLFGRIYSRDLNPYSVVYRNELDARPSSLALQSIYNNLLGLAAIVIFLPIMFLIAAILRVSRSGPVFCKKTCAGLHGIPFNSYRFRVTSAPGILNWLLTRFRLEGLPQILNVVRGEVALIGPRAERLEFQEILNEVIPFYSQRYHVKPGIFGWSQLHCDPLPEEDALARIEYDLYYIKHVSLLLDAYVVLRGLRWILSDPHVPHRSS